MNDEQSSYSVAMVNREEGYDSEGMKKNEKYFGTIALSLKYSVEDVISVAKRITVQNINGEWHENIPDLSDLKAYTEVMQ